MLLGVAGVLLYYNWINEAVESAHVMPQAERCDIGSILMKQEYTEEDLQILSEQTGLNESIISDLLQQGREEELLEIQKIYFAPVQIESIETTPITISEWLVDEEGKDTEGMPLVDVRNGDILITKNSRFLGWRNGHAGLVVDCERGLVLEALMLGTESLLCKIDKWESCPSFMVLRLKEGIVIGKEVGEPLLSEDICVCGKSEGASSVEIAETVAAYAKNQLVGIPYHLLAGVFEWEGYAATSPDTVQAAGEGNEYASEIIVDENEEETKGNGIETEQKPEDLSVLSGTQCAHLVWYAYKQVGIDLDSDGGIFVTPYDILNSPYLEVVQSYGY